jgi:hypothetical protein
MIPVSSALSGREGEAVRPVSGAVQCSAAGAWGSGVAHATGVGVCFGTTAHVDSSLTHSLLPHYYTA